MAAGGGFKRRYQYCSDNLGTIVYLRALQGHSGSNLIDPTLQDNVLIGPGIFPYIYHVGSTFNLYSIVSNGLVLGGQNLCRRQTVFFLLVDPRKEDHKDPEYIDFSVPRLARYLQNAWKRHQDTVFWIDIDLGMIKERLRFYQTRSNAIMIEIGRTEQVILEMDKLANEDHSYKASKAEIEFYRGNWWIHTNVARVDSIPTRYEPEFKSALSTMQRLKRAEDKKKQETLTQTSSSSSSWHWHSSWWESDFEHSPQKWYDR